MKTTSKAHQPTAARFAKIEGKRIHYLTAGQGPVLILLHGYRQTSRMWRPLIDRLKDKFTIIAPDLPGIGDSDIAVELHLAHSIAPSWRGEGGVSLNKGCFQSSQASDIPSLRPCRGVFLGVI